MICIGEVYTDNLTCKKLQTGNYYAYLNSLSQPLFFTNDLMLVKSHSTSDRYFWIQGFGLPNGTDNLVWFGAQYRYASGWTYGYINQLVHVDDYHFIDFTNFRFFTAGRDLFVVWEINSNMNSISMKTSYQTLRIGNPHTKIYFVRSTDGSKKGSIIALAEMGSSIYHRRYTMDNDYSVSLTKIYTE